MTAQIENIQKMEQIFNTMNTKIEDIETAINNWEKYFSEFKQLEDYYSSQEWFEDRNSYAYNEFSKDLKCGVLSEDAVYNLIIKQRELGIRLAKLGIQVVE